MAFSCEVNHLKIKKIITPTHLTLCFARKYFKSLDFTHRISCSNAIGSFCSRKRTENDTLYKSESQRGESKTGDQKLLWKLMQPYTFGGVLISSGRLSYTLNWFTFQSMHLPHTKSPEARTFSAVYSCPCSGEEDSLASRNRFFGHVDVRRLVFYFSPFIWKICDIIIYICRCSTYLETIERAGNARLILIKYF